MDKEIKQLLDKYPFMSFIVYGNSEYIGIIQNSDQYITNIYDISKISDSKQKERFLNLGDQWWWESNRQVPINIFLREEWVIFKPYLKTFNNKNLILVHGPVISLGDFNKKRIRRKSITLVRRLP